jgi:hypothetical protein
MLKIKIIHDLTVYFKLITKFIKKKVNVSYLWKKKEIKCASI